MSLGGFQDQFIPGVGNVRGFIRPPNIVPQLVALPTGTQPKAVVPQVCTPPLLWSDHLGRCATLNEIACGSPNLHFNGLTGQCEIPKPTPPGPTGTPGPPGGTVGGAQCAPWSPPGKCCDPLGDTTSSCTPQAPGPTCEPCGPEVTGGTTHDSTSSTGVGPGGLPCCPPGTGATDDICKCLGNVGAQIAGPIDDLIKQLQESFKKPCDSIDGCIDEIITQLFKKLHKPAKTCEQCKTDAQAGLAGTLEFALSCAGACINEAKAEVKCLSASDDGKTCKGCGCEPCKCDNLKCVPVDPTACQQPQPQPPQTPPGFIGWCDPTNGDVLVTSADGLPPGPNYLPTDIADTEALAFAEAARNCQLDVPQQPGIPSVNIPAVGIPGCDVLEYTDGTVASAIAAAQPGLNIVAGTAEVWTAIGRLGIGGLNLENVGEVLAGLYTQFTSSIPVAADELLPKIAGVLGCDDPTWLMGMQSIAALGMTKKMIGADFDDFTWHYRYAMNATCRQKHLGQGEAFSAYLADGIDEHRLNAYAAIHGLCPDDIADHLAAIKAKPIPQELVNLRNRKLIDADDYAKRMRRLGYIDADVPELLYNATEAIPNMVHIVDFATKGIDNESVVSSLGLNDGFTDLWSGQNQHWLEANHVTEEMAAALWRDHWVSPGYGTLSEFYRRFRDNEAFGSEDEQIELIKAELKRQAIPDVWQERYIGVLEHPLLRRDIQRAFSYGSLKEDELRPNYRMQGYNDDAVDTLVVLNKQLRRHQIHNHVALRQWMEWQIGPAACKEQLGTDGYSPEDIALAMQDVEYQFVRSVYIQAFERGTLPRDKALQLLTEHGVTATGAQVLLDRAAVRIVSPADLRSYVAGTASRDEARLAMLSRGMLGDIADTMLDDADKEVKITLSTVCQNGLKSRYIHGEITKEEARTYLSQYNVEEARVELLVNNWDCEKSALGRPVLVHTLADWLGEGIITQADFSERLMRLGYSAVNSENILNSVLYALNVKRQKQQAAQARQQASELRREEAAAKRLTAEVQRQSAKLAAMRSKAAKARQNRDKQLLSAAEKLYKASGDTLAASVAKAKDMVYVCQNQYGLTTDESLATVLLAADRYPKGTLADFDSYVTDLASAAATFNSEPMAVLAGVSPSSNGSTHPSG